MKNIRKLSLFIIVLSSLSYSQITFPFLNKYSYNSSQNSYMTQLCTRLNNNLENVFYSSSRICKDCIYIIPGLTYSIASNSMKFADKYPALSIVLAPLVVYAVYKVTEKIVRIAYNISQSFFR